MLNLSYLLERTADAGVQALLNAEALRLGLVTVEADAATVNRRLRATIMAPTTVDVSYIDGCKLSRPIRCY